RSTGRKAWRNAVAMPGRGGFADAVVAVALRGWLFVAVAAAAGVGSAPHSSSSSSSNSSGALWVARYRRRASARAVLLARGTDASRSGERVRAILVQSLPISGSAAQMNRACSPDRLSGETSLAHLACHRT